MTTSLFLKADSLIKLSSKWSIGQRSSEATMLSIHSTWELVERHNSAVTKVYEVYLQEKKKGFISKLIK